MSSAPLVGAGDEFLPIDQILIEPQMPTYGIIDINEESNSPSLLSADMLALTHQSIHNPMYLEQGNRDSGLGLESMLGDEDVEL